MKRHCKQCDIRLSVQDTLDGVQRCQACRERNHKRATGEIAEPTWSTYMISEPSDGRDELYTPDDRRGFRGVDLRHRLPHFDWS